jgi:transposase
MEKGNTIAVDVAQSIFEVAVSRFAGQIAQRPRLPRSEFLAFLARQPRATVVLEACGSASYWARQIEPLGHRVVLLPPRHVRRYRSGNKTDRTDAKALLEAFRNEEIRPVPVKSPEQQALAALHRLRSAWLDARTARLNAIRGFLREQGILLPRGARHVVPRTLACIEDAELALPAALRFALFEACCDVRELEQRLRRVEQQLETFAREFPLVARLRSVPGIGLLTATAIAAFVGDLTRFPSGRHFASYLGLTPREHSSGLVRRLGAISKRGDVYLRMLLTHGARSLLAAAVRHRNPDPLRRKAIALAARVGHNKATIAFANKLARYAWAVATRNSDFEVRRLVA